MLRNFFISCACLVLALSVHILPAQAVTSEFCLCNDNLDTITTENYKTKDAELQQGNYCALKIPPAECNPEAIQKKFAGTGKYAECTSDFDNLTSCQDEAKAWELTKQEKLKAAADATAGIKSTKSNFIPDCALADTLAPPCDDISIFLILAINISRYVFSIVGGLSLLMFVYAGFTLIISQGNSEKIEQGKSIMTAVVIGLLIAFGGYLLVNFLGQSLGLQANFRLL